MSLRCNACNTLMAPVFNLMKCPYSCNQRVQSLRCSFPNFWSHYAEKPWFLRTEYPNRSEADIFKVADAVVVFEQTGSLWDKSAAIKDSEILVIKNTTWDRTVGKVFMVTMAQETALIENKENCPEQIAGMYNRPHMVCLARKYQG